ncbi:MULTISPECIES: chorismate-binding protein [Polaribacter]|uniref:isochorismate synthase n=1 Tax=Polaribacter sejongensis TaxID=985043 RepID=A0AAJ1VHI7_9FLAO|nr:MULTISPECIES: chorismate-binding protein [Polaribacter]MDN3620711.1 chorismate-binding protein [Polaribacter undariae]UWD32101.1 chorismate-binding protein [Polaribacter undariae]
MNIIFNKIEENYKRNIPFVVYRKPNTESVNGFFMKDDTLHFTTQFKETGFVFAPFNADEKAVLFPLEKSEFIHENILIEENLSLNDTVSSEVSSDKEKHLHLVEKALDEINNNELIKVVVSRKEEIQLDEFDVLLTFKKLLNTYANAFVYVWFHPKVGLWFGATPETLLNITGNTFKTMSLAGTQVYVDTEEVVWRGKELDEQQLVTDFIESQLKPISTNLKIDKTETVRAGNLLHLRSSVEGELRFTSNLKTLIRSLHPTPAVCGLPREKAEEFISKYENYKRTFYSGFLGELNIENKNSSLFVNLRCMSVADKIASIYVGGGITKDSSAKKEWEETVAKTKTIKKVL